MLLDDLDAKGTAFKKYIENTGKVCFFTGAGISTQSGIPDFRSPGGIWSRYRIIEYGEFIESEEARLEDWDRRFHMNELFDQAEPNPAHHMIAKMVESGMATGVITQNIDGLHQRALEASSSAEKIVEFHGTGTYAHCLTCRKKFTMQDMQHHIDHYDTSPFCDCGGVIKAAVISFGEAIPENLLERAVSIVDSAKSMVVVGSSLQVWPATGLLERALCRNMPLCIINRDPTPFDDKADLILRGNASEVAETVYEFLSEAN